MSELPGNFHDRLLRQITRLFKGASPSIERPTGYIQDDYDLLYLVDGSLQRLIDRSSFQDLQYLLQNEITDRERVVDIGAGRNFLRGVVFLDAVKTIAVDPAYKWYDHHPRDPFGSRPYPSGVFGGQGERDEMENLLQSACRNLQIPARMNKAGATHIEGARDGERKSFELIPEDANTWLLNQKPQTVSNYVVYRVFPSPLAWGHLISSLKVGGLILTTGFGKQSDRWGSGNLKFNPDISQGGGVDIDNSQLPISGNSEAIGLESIAKINHVNFYRKRLHLNETDLSQIITDNQ